MGDDFAYDLRWTIVLIVLFVTRGVEDPPIAVAGGILVMLSNLKSTIGSNTIVQFTDIRATSIAGQRTLEI
jgi:hypothetical protein